MEWIKFQNPAFTLDQPTDWRVELHPGPVTTVTSPAGDAFALIEAFAINAADTPTAILSQLRFPTAKLFPEAKPEKVQAGPGGSVNMFVSYRMPAGLAWRARVACVPSGQRVTIFTSAAPAHLFATHEPTLTRILMSFRPASAGPPPVPTQPKVPPPAAAPNLRSSIPMMADLTVGFPALIPSATRYTRFTDPQMGTFSVEVPVGWKVRGGLNHPMLGDRRAWVEAISPDGIYILNGDPEFPQNFCHFPGNKDGVPLTQAGGSVFINLTPSADRLADHYLKTLAPSRFGPFQPQPRRQRPDMVEFIRGQYVRMGFNPPKTFKIWAVETPVQISQAGVQRVGSLLETGSFNGQYMMGMFTYWAGNVFLYIAPPALAAQAEAVRFRMMQSYLDTPRMAQLVQQDEAMITAAGQAAHAAQLNWFANQQAGYRAQQAFGDAIVDNYWKHQQSNDAMMRGWEKSQAVNDRLSQDRSDQILDRQRLADDAMGKSYDAPAGYNYYWLDQQSDQIIGTNTSDPPDLSRNYTQLRRV